MSGVWVVAPGLIIAGNLSEIKFFFTRKDLCFVVVDTLVE